MRGARRGQKKRTPLQRCLGDLIGRIGARFSCHLGRFGRVVQTDLRSCHWIALRCVLSKQIARFGQIRGDRDQHLQALRNFGVRVQFREWSAWTWHVRDEAVVERQGIADLVRVVAGPVGLLAELRVAPVQRQRRHLVR